MIAGEAYPSGALYSAHPEGRILALIPNIRATWKGLQSGHSSFIGQHPWRRKKFYDIDTRRKKSEGPHLNCWLDGGGEEHPEGGLLETDKMLGEEIEAEILPEKWSDIFGRHDIQNNDIQRNDTEYNRSQHNDALH